MHSTESRDATASPQLPSSALGVGARAWSTLAVAAAIYSFNIADRFVFPALLQPIEVEFSLSDTGGGSLNLALVLMLMLFGIPSGMLADRFSRRHLLGACATLFSAMTLLGGLSNSLLAFVATRMGMGLGEAGCTPASLTLIANRFPVARRGVAMTIFTLGVFAGAYLGTVLAGALSDHYGWRTTMLAFGLAGLQLGALAMFLIRESLRGGMDPATMRAEATDAGLLATLNYIRRDKALLFVILGGAAICTWGWGLLRWAPALLMRTYGLTGGQVGAVLGKLHLVGGVTATLFTVFLMYWLSRMAARLQLWVIASLIACAAMASIVACRATDLSVLVLCLWLSVPVLCLNTGPTFSLINNMAPPSIRAKTISIFLIATTFGSLIQVPMVIGFLSDIFVSGGVSSGEGLRVAMRTFSPLGLVAAAAYIVAGIFAGSRTAIVTPSLKQSSHHHV